MKIAVKNFQSIESAALEAGGLTVVTGRSNVGKTALIRAVQAALFGLPGDFYIREGADSCGVALKVDDLDVAWRKVRAPTPGKVTALRVGTTTHTKIGKDHNVLTEGLGIRELETSGPTLRPQFAMQHDPIFLLGESESTVAEVLKLLGRTDVVTKAQAEAKKDLRATASKKEVREGDREALEPEVKRFAGVPVLRDRWTNVNDRLKSAEQGQVKVGNTTAILRRLKTLIPCEVPLAPLPPDLILLTRVERLRRLGEILPQKVPIVPGVPSVPASKLAMIESLKSLRVIRLADEAGRQVAYGVGQELVGLGIERSRMETDLKICPTCERSFG